MSDTSDTGDVYTADSTGKPEASVTYVLGLSFAILILLITLSYASYMCNRSRLRNSRSPPAADDDDDSNHLLRLSRGVDDAVLMTFPAFVYSEHKVDSTADANNNGSDCSICLADYKGTDVVRLLPKCGHFFHRRCIDTWLKVHPTCPVCRNSPLPDKLSIQIQRS